MSKFKPCHTCNQKECDFKHDGKDFVCSCGYVLTADDKQRMLHESYEAGIRNGEFSELKSRPMAVDEAVSILKHSNELLKTHIDEISAFAEQIPVGDDQYNSLEYCKREYEAVNMAVKIMRRAQPTNEPLTLEQVKEHLSKHHPYDVEPLYVVFDPPIPIDYAPRWRDAYNLSQLITAYAEDYGKSWIAYARKPEEVSHAQ